MLVSDLQTKVNGISEELTILQKEISESYDAYASKQLGYENTEVQKEITELNAQKKMYDRKFQEKEGQFQTLGGKTRRQTLQEYTLLLFFVSYFVFTFSLAIWKSVKGEFIGGLKIFGLLCIMLIPIVGLMLKFL